MATTDDVAAWLQTPEQGQYTSATDHDVVLNTVAGGGGAVLLGNAQASIGPAALYVLDNAAGVRERPDAESPFALSVNGSTRLRGDGFLKCEGPAVLTSRLGPPSSPPQTLALQAGSLEVSDAPLHLRRGTHPLLLGGRELVAPVSRSTILATKDTRTLSHGVRVSHISGVAAADGNVEVRHVPKEPESRQGFTVMSCTRMEDGTLALCLQIGAGQTSPASLFACAKSEEVLALLTSFQTEDRFWVFRVLGVRDVRRSFPRCVLHLAAPVFSSATDFSTPPFGALTVDALVVSPICHHLQAMDGPVRVSWNASVRSGRTGLLQGGGDVPLLGGGQVVRCLLGDPLRTSVPVSDVLLQTDDSLLLTCTPQVLDCVGYGRAGLGAGELMAALVARGRTMTVDEVFGGRQVAFTSVPSEYMGLASEQGCYALLYCEARQELWAGSLSATGVFTSALTATSLPSGDMAGESVVLVCLQPRPPDTPQGTGDLVAFNSCVDTQARHLRLTLPPGSAPPGSAWDSLVETQALVAVFLLGTRVVGRVVATSARHITLEPLRGQDAVAVALVACPVQCCPGLQVWSEAPSVPVMVPLSWSWALWNPRESTCHLVGLQGNDPLWPMQLLGSFIELVVIDDQGTPLAGGPKNPGSSP
jgi:hypothetical protein